MRTAMQAADWLQGRAEELRQDAKHAFALDHHRECEQLAVAAAQMQNAANHIREAAVAFLLDAEAMSW